MDQPVPQIRSLTKLGRYLDILIPRPAVSLFDSITVISSQSNISIAVLFLGFNQHP